MLQKINQSQIEVFLRFNYDREEFETTIVFIKCNNRFKYASCSINLQVKKRV
jgi:hypothetical protein